MNVVRIVAERVQALRAALRDVVLVGRHCQLIRAHDIGVASYPQIDVRGHVDNVAGAGHQRQQAIGFLLGPLGNFGRLPDVNPVVKRARMFRIRRDHALESRHGLLGPLLCFPVPRPVVPRPQVHQRLGKHRRRIEVARVFLRERAHRIGKRAIGGLPAVGLPGVACRERVDVGTLARRHAACERLRLLHERERFGFVLGGHRGIDVRAKDKSLPPVRHRTRRVETRCFRKRAARFGVIEPIREVEALIDE